MQLNFQTPVVWKGENNLLGFDFALFFLKVLFDILLKESGQILYRFNAYNCLTIQGEGTVKIYVWILEITPPNLGQNLTF